MSGRTGTVEERVERRLAAILAADVAGYSRLMGEDEESTLATLQAYRRVIDALIQSHNGRVFGSAGDSVVAEFASPVEAVRCATEIQLDLDKQSAGIAEARRMRFRIGVHLGDVMVEGNNLMGDGVNVAARLENLAAPGGLCISDNVIPHVRDRLGLEFEDLGQHQVKNISHPVHVYRIPLVSEFRDASPYRGLSVFEYEDARFFHGRARAIATVKERLETQAAAGLAFLLVYGMSGAGKSSLVRAGVLPVLTRPGAIDGVTVARYCVFRPSEGPDPRAALLLALRRSDALPEIEGLPGIDRLYEQAPQAVVSTITAALSRVGGPNVRLFVVVDQLEELFTADVVDGATQEAFVDLLDALARSGAVWVIGTIRTDCLHHCASTPRLSQLKDGLGSYELLPPAGPEIAQIVRNPARTVGVRFEESAEEGRLEDVLQQAAASDPASLPLLEFVLDALYEAGKDRRLLAFVDYRALGGLEGAIAKRADEVTGALPHDVQQALPRMISALTTVRQQDEAATGRSALRRELETTLAQTALVEALIDARLLVSDEGTEGASMVRFAHEALLSQWPLARDIITANREFLSTRSRVRADAQRWRAEERSADLLLPPGKRLAEAEEMLLARREDVDDQTIEYAETSVAAQRAREDTERQRLETEEAAKRERLELEAAAARRVASRTRVAAFVTLALAIVAAAGAFVGFRGQQEATRQAELAKQNSIQAEAAERKAERQAAQARLTRDEALAARNRTFQQVKQLVASGQDLNKSDSFGTPLHHAVLDGHEVIVELLLDAGADPNAVARDGSVPLHWAAFKGHIDIARRLIEAGASPEAQSSANGAALHLAADRGHTAMVELLMANGADVNAPRQASLAPALLLAAREGHMELVELLISKDADVNLRDIRGATALVGAAASGHTEIAELLIAQGANVNIHTSDWGETPLHGAAQGGHMPLVKLLLSAGADPNATSTQPMRPGTPLDWALRAGQIEVAELLRKHGEIGRTRPD